MNSICFFHRADLDGVCSAAIVKKFVPDCELHGIDYGDEPPWGKLIPEFPKREDGGPEFAVWRQVYLVDVSFPPADMKRLAESCDLVWCDHHRTALDANMGLHAKGYQTSELSGCELTWLWFTRAEGEPYLVRGSSPTPEQLARLPEAVRLLGRYDIFDLGNVPEVEIYAPVRGWEGLYDVSTFGSVRARARPVVNHVGETSGRHPGGIMSPSLNGAGYMQVQLRRGPEIVAKQVHRLVAEAFFLNPEGLSEVNHRDGVRTNNRADNLEWCSRHYNAFHASRRRGVRRLPDGRFDARCAVGGVRHWLGVFDTEAAARAAQEAFVASRGLLRVSRQSVFWARIEAFQFGMRSLPAAMDPTSSCGFCWNDLLSGGLSCAAIADRGYAILSYRDQEAKALCSDGGHILWLTDGKGFIREIGGKLRTAAFRIIAMNTLQRGSWQFNSVWDPAKYDAMCVYGQLKDGRWRVSLYSTKPEVDCGAICKSLGGGGHAGAAGFICDELPWRGA